MHQCTVALVVFALFNLFFVDDATKVATNNTAALRFELFVEEYGREYVAGKPEFQRRLQYFQERLAAIELQNSKPNRRWTAAINHLSDRSPEEMKALNGWKGGVAYAVRRSASSVFLEAGKSTTGDARWLNPLWRPFQAVKASLFGSDGFRDTPTMVQEEAKKQDPTAGLPEIKDWTTLWMAQPSQVHSQRCGDCWAATTASLLEAHAEIYTGKKRHFSFEEITKCTENPFSCGGDGGCRGATSELALQHVMMNGIGHEEGAGKCASKQPAHIVNKNEDAPHEWGAGIRMSNDDAKGREFGMIGWERLPVNKNEPLMRALVELGPVAVAVATNWRDYGKGIYDGCSKNAEISHSVLAMGYGRDAHSGDKYWLIQNSWGRGFGENGHMRLLRHDKEEDWCGIDSRPELGTTCRGGPSEVKVCGMCGILFDATVPHFSQSQA